MQPHRIVSREQWLTERRALLACEKALTKAVDEAIAANPDIVARVREGKVAAAGPLVGAVMKATGGKADAARVRQLIMDRLS